MKTIAKFLDIKNKKLTIENSSKDNFINSAKKLINSINEEISEEDIKSCTKDFLKILSIVIIK